MATQTINIDFNNPSSNTIALGAVAGAALPANTKLLGITTTGNCHFRLGVAGVTATITDPLLTPNSEIQVLVVPGDATNISVIADAQTPNTGVFSFFRVFEA